MRFSFEANTTTSMSSSKASTCQNASFNHAQVMTLSTILVVLILMFVINMIIPIIRDELIVMIMLAVGYKSKPKLVKKG